MTITLAEEVRLLASVDCLKPLSKEELEEFAKRQPDAYYEPGEILSTPCEEDERLLILKKGRIRIYRMDVARPKADACPSRARCDARCSPAARVLCRSYGARNHPALGKRGHTTPHREAPRGGLA